MEPQEVFCYDKKEDRCNNNKCFGIITVILAIAFSFVGYGLAPGWFKQTGQMFEFAGASL